MVDTRTARTGEGALNTMLSQCVSGTELDHKVVLARNLSEISRGRHLKLDEYSEISFPGVNALDKQGA
jgi:hypothetical protein